MFEQVVRSTKRCMKKTIGRVLLTYDELLTALAEGETILNSRSLSYISTEAPWRNPSLYPTYWLVIEYFKQLTRHWSLSTSNNLPDMSVFDGESAEDYDPSVSSSDLSQRIKHLGHVLDHFGWKWRDEYLLELKESHRYMCTKGSQQTENVLVADYSLSRQWYKAKRCLWKLAKVEKLMKGSDGAFVKISTKKKVSTISKCSI